jgi:hypothetical protein
MALIENAPIVSMRRDRKGFKLEDGTWYSNFTPLEGVSMGDVVTFEYQTKGSFNNIKGSVKVIGGGGGSAPAASGGKPASSGGGWKQKKFPIAVDDGARAINRQNALAHAVNGIAVINTDATLHKWSDEKYAEEVIQLARRFEAYTTGDLDVAIGEAMAEADAAD